MQMLGRWKKSIYSCPRQTEGSLEVFPFERGKVIFQVHLAPSVNGEKVSISDLGRWPYRRKHIWNL